MTAHLRKNSSPPMPMHRHFQRFCALPGVPVMQLSNAIKETKPKVWRVSTLRHRTTLGFMMNLLDFLKHLFREREMSFLRDISETTQCQQECQLTERTVEKRNLSEQKLRCFTVKARVHQTIFVPLAPCPWAWNTSGPWRLPTEFSYSVSQMYG